MLNPQGFSGTEGKSANTVFSFNEKVMIGLIESGYIQRELEMSGDTSIYPKLLVYLLAKPTSSIHLKSTICREMVKP